ncbi:hypothetical protein V6N12_063981 [Hibiscus sabdariffa]
MLEAFALAKANQISGNTIVLFDNVMPKRVNVVPSRAMGGRKEHMPPRLAITGVVKSIKWAHAPLNV